jgi:hypothetical protein
MEGHVNSFVLTKNQFYEKVWTINREFLVAVTGFTQQITGTVKDQQGKPVSGSTVSLLNAKDSSVVKLAASNNEGQIFLQFNKSGKYLIGITHVGYGNSYSHGFEFSGAGEHECAVVALTNWQLSLRVSR